MTRLKGYRRPRNLAGLRYVVPGVRHRICRLVGRNPNVWLVGAWEVSR